jgi:hypothetical protein
MYLFCVCARRRTSATCTRIRNRIATRRPTPQVIFVYHLFVYATHARAYPSRSASLIFTVIRPQSRRPRPTSPPPSPRRPVPARSPRRRLRILRHWRIAPTPRDWRAVSPRAEISNAKTADSVDIQVALITYHSRAFSPKPGRPAALPHKVRISVVVYEGVGRRKSCSVDRACACKTHLYDHCACVRRRSCSPPSRLMRSWSGRGADP